MKKKKREKKKMVRKKKNNFVCLILCLAFVFLFMNLFAASDFGEDIVKDNYRISRSQINRTLVPGALLNDFIGIENLGTSILNVNLEVVGDLDGVFELKNSSISVASGTSERAYFLIKGDEGEYEGILKLGGGVNQEIPIQIIVSEQNITQPFLIELKGVKEKYDISKNISFQTSFKKLQKENFRNVTFNYSIVKGNDTFFLDSFQEDFNNSFSFIVSYSVPEDLDTGDYVLSLVTTYEDFESTDEVYFILKHSFWNIPVFGIFPMWVLICVLGFLAAGFLTFYIIKKRIESKKKYKMRLDTKTIPKKTKENLFLGKIAESNKWAYFEPNKLTVHSIVAGATGGGKSITAQVMIEELLMKNIAVIVFDPTAQWSGMLRKCTDKKMMSHYSKFGLKPQDARAFKGNVRMIKNARQVIDLQKYINPGQIQIFSLNKLDPKDMDIFVASIIRQIFKSDPKEYPGLKVLFVFDEVHRLLPKFGGSGEGFLQIERGCREFRKWGLGIMLVSQVLADFVGEIKANISTEIQMRTRDEGDLKRIETKNGEEFLQSLVKASAGFGMFSNPAYNHAQPYFINFRPILHNTKRLTDEELEEYNKYNDQVDEFEFQLEALEKEKVDTFDYKMELKLIKDKIMTGSFSVVQIYIEGFGPRLKKEWEKLGKKPPERKIELVSEEEIQKAIVEAKKKHEKEKSKEAASGEVAKKEEQKLEDKIVSSLTFDNGAMMSSLKELKEYLPTMDVSVFKLHVNDKKNDVQKWMAEQFGAEFGKAVEGKTAKDDLAKTIEEICKNNGIGGGAKESEKKEGDSSKEGEKVEEKKDGEEKPAEGETKKEEVKKEEGGEEKK